MMKNSNLKVGQKLASPSKNDLYVHPYVEVALCIWQKLRPKTTYINMKCEGNFYRPPLRLVDGGDNTFYFFNDFQRVGQVLRLENDSDYPCLIIPESIKDTQKLAWIEVIDLMYFKDIHHPDLFKALKSTAHQSVICQPMGIRHLTVKEHCHFAGISRVVMNITNVSLH